MLHSAQRSTASAAGILLPVLCRKLPSMIMVTDRSNPLV